jgi:hypothetical protein
VTDEHPVVSVPADLELDERLVGPITFRMAAWLAVAGTGVVLAALGPGPAAAAVGVLFVLAGLAGAFWAPAGRPALAWLRPLVAYRRRTGGSRRRWQLPGRIRRIRRRPAERNQPPQASASAAPTDPAPRSRRRLVILAAAVLALLATGGAVGRYVRGHFVPTPPPVPAQEVPPATGPSPHDEGWWIDCGC